MSLAKLVAAIALPVGAFFARRTVDRERRETVRIRARLAEERACGLGRIREELELEYQLMFRKVEEILKDPETAPGEIADLLPMCANLDARYAKAFGYKLGLTDMLVPYLLANC